jgi:hypothetical protein
MAFGVDFGSVSRPLLAQEGLVFFTALETLLVG